MGYFGFNFACTLICFEAIVFVDILLLWVYKYVHLG